MLASDRIALDMMHHMAQGPNPTEVQSLIFDADDFSVSEAKAWAKSHDFKSGSVGQTGESLRLRQAKPSEFNRNSFRTIELDEGVHAVIGKRKRKDVAASIDLKTFMLGSDGVERAMPNTAPTAFRIWKAGQNPTDHGMTLFTDKSAELLMQEQTKRGNLYSIDVDHASLKDDAPIENKRAVGWHRLEVRPTADGPELWAVSLEWSDVARAALEKDPPEWRYFSPAYRLDPETNEVISYLNTAITINPATWNNTALATRGATLENKQMTMSEIKAALAAMAEAEDADEADKKMAAKMMAAMGDDDSSMPPPKDSSAPPPKKDDEDGDKDSSMPPAKKDEDEEDMRAAKSAYAAVAASAPKSHDAEQVELATKFRELELRVAELATRDERRALLASRPDLAKSGLKKFLESAPIAVVREVCANTPKQQKAAPAAAAAVTGTRGDSQGDGTTMYVPPSEKEFIDRKMGLAPKTDSVRKEGNKLVLGAIDNAEAEKILASKSANGAKAGA